MPTPTNPLSYLTDQLNDLKAKGTYFRLRVLEDEQEPVCTFDGKKVINLASNNYLGLTTHPKLRGTDNRRHDENSHGAGRKDRPL
jgi:glycine C-acetyltransferase